jgi:hypothetical protein
MNIFETAANLELQERLQNLIKETTTIWGKMNAAQMVLHAQKPLDVADGKLVLGRSLIGFLFGRMAKNSFLKQDDLRKNMPTAPQFKVEVTPNFDIEKEVLMNLIKKFGTIGTQVLVNKKHPFFGSMTDEEWGVLQYKHLDHHFNQFGI